MHFIDGYIVFSGNGLSIFTGTIWALGFMFGVALTLYLTTPKRDEKGRFTK